MLESTRRIISQNQDKTHNAHTQWNQQRTMKVRKKAKIRSRYNQAPHLTQEITWASDKNTIKHRIQESQRVSPFPAGDHRAAKQQNHYHRADSTLIHCHQGCVCVCVCVGGGGGGA